MQHTTNTLPGNHNTHTQQQPEHLNKGTQCTVDTVDKVDSVDTLDKEKKTQDKEMKTRTDT